MPKNTCQVYNTEHVGEGQPYHNAWTKSLIGTLKAEMLQDGCFVDERDSRIEILEFIESYYNNHRKHSSLGYLIPNQFDADLASLN